MLRQSAASTQYVQVPVFARSGGVEVDPTGETVEMAFPEANDAPTVWHAASWDDDDGTYFAQCLVGPDGGVELTVGNYDVYVKVEAAPETPVLPGGRLQVY